MADVQITGVLGQDAEVRFTPGGDAVCSFSVADDLRRKSQSGEWETVSTTWWRCQVWGRTAETLAEHLTKGTKVLVAGTVHERKWQDKDGGERSSFDVKARTVGLIPKAGASSRQPAGDPWASDGVPAGEPPF